MTFEEFTEKQKHTRRGRAINVALQYGGIDGGHHKMWVIDQMLRELLEESAYKDAIALYENDSEYEWDVGIPP